MKTIFHVFLRIIAFLQTPRPDPEGSMTGVMKAWTLEQQVSVRYEHRLHTCWLFPRPSHEGTAWGKTRRSGLCQCLALGKIDQGKFCSLVRSNSWTQSGLCTVVRQRLQAPDPLHQIPCSALILIARSLPDLYSNNWAQRGAGAKMKTQRPGSVETPLKIPAGKSSGI